MLRVGLSHDPLRFYLSFDDVSKKQSVIVKDVFQFCAAFGVLKRYTKVLGREDTVNFVG